MIKINRSPHFNRNFKKYVKKNTSRAESVLFALNTFRHNPNNPGLNTEKLVNSDNWSFRINRGDRIFFVWIDKTTVLLVDIGSHDKYRSY